MARRPVTKAVIFVAKVERVMEIFVAKARAARVMVEAILILLAKVVRVTEVIYVAMVAVMTVLAEVGGTGNIYKTRHIMVNNRVLV